jgi:hypothetical protein
VPAEADLYIWLYLKSKRLLEEPYYVAEIICKSSFDGIQARCKKLITEEDR